MKNIKQWIWIQIFLCAFLTAPLVHADETPTASDDKESFFQKRRQEWEKKIQEVYDQLNLTDEQKKKLEANKAGHRDTMKALFEKMRSYRQALNDELMKPDLNMGHINEIQAQVKTLQAEITDHRLNSILEVRAILTPEQFAKFISLMEKQKMRSKFSEEK